MAFLDNSGDIILDAVLTDTGRFRLAKGDGSFKIVKFALSDDEINYRLYNKNHPSGSAYYDLEIMQTPILEAFTNNTSTMNYKLLSIPRTNLLYLPVMRINDQLTYGTINSQNNGYVVAVTDNTQKSAEVQVGSTSLPGIMDGETPSAGEQRIRIDQGIDNAAINFRNRLDQDLRETQFIIEMDSRLGYLVDYQSNAPADISFIDDDNIASYYVSDGDGSFVSEIFNTATGFAGGGPSGWPTSANDQWAAGNLVIRGATGPALQFKIGSSLDLITSDYLFEMLGGSWGSSDTAEAANWGFNDANKNYVYIDSIVKITGATTGYKLDIPVRYVKCTDCNSQGG